MIVGVGGHWSQRLSIFTSMLNARLRHHIAAMAVVPDPTLSEACADSAEALPALIWYCKAHLVAEDSDWTRADTGNCGRQ